MVRPALVPADEAQRADREGAVGAGAVGLGDRDCGRLPSLRRRLSGVDTPSTGRSVPEPHGSSHRPCLPLLPRQGRSALGPGGRGPEGREDI